MSTAYHFDRDKRANLNIYVKPTGAAASPWSTGVIAFTAVSGGQAGLYSGDVDDDTAYVVYIRAGASPASTDEAVGFIELATQTKAQADAAFAEVVAAVEAVDVPTADEIVDDIVARGITAIPVQSGVTSSGNLDLIQGDTYDGSAKPLLSFPTSADYTSGWTATLTIRDEDDAVVATASGTVASATQVTVSLTTPTGLTFSGCPGLWQGKFDVQMSKNTQRATIATGTAYIREDQTRT